MIEHNLDVIGAADWIVALGPEGGRDGGVIVAEGTPETIVAHHATSHTARYLKERLAEPPSSEPFVLSPVGGTSPRLPSRP